MLNKHVRTSEILCLLLLPVHFYMCELLALGYVVVHHSTCISSYYRNNYIQYVYLSENIHNCHVWQDFIQISSFPAIYLYFISSWRIPILSQATVRNKVQKIDLGVSVYWDVEGPRRCHPCKVTNQHLLRFETSVARWYKIKDPPAMFNKFQHLIQETWQ